MGPIAIIGVSCRFPGAPGVEAFWRLLREGVDAVTELPAGRAEACALPGSRPARDEPATRWGGFLERVDEFDASFFGISPGEARTLDPQQRLLLEAAWEALEDAGQVVERLAASRTGVFVGIGPGDYGRLALQDRARISQHTNTGNFLSIAANRISYTFDFHGPSVAIDTACSSALVAAHLACQSISTGECDAALVGGVNVILAPELTLGMDAMGALSPDGRCRAFDARANGYVRGEGVGFVVLKPLAAALADDDPVYAVILGSAVNQNGRTNGLTAPSGRYQEAVLREACRAAGISPERVQYVEAHASSTPIGDLIEAEALGAVYGAARPHGDFCRIGSLKTNVGHLEMASGVAGLIKVALALDRREIPPSLHFNEPNPLIRFDESRLRVQTALSPWPASDARAAAAVSSFGLGGTNAHVIMEAPQREPAAGPRGAEFEDGRAHLLPLSARSPDALPALARSYLRFLSEERDGSAPSPGDVCYTAAARRSHHDYRLSFTFRSLGEFRSQVEAYLRGETPPGVASGRRSATNLQRQLKAADKTAGLTPNGGEGQAARLESVGKLYALGWQVDWSEVYPLKGRCVRLPPYPWQRQRHWLDGGGD